MRRPSSLTVDVRDMLCAQALAVVAKAMAPLPAGTWAAARYTTEDVRRDLIAWAASRGYGVRDADGSLELGKR